MQLQLEADHPNLQIQILAVNEWGHASANANAAGGRDLPLLQDEDKDGNFESDVWESWDADWRDVMVVNGQGEIVKIYNLTVMDLRNAANFDELKLSLVETAETNPVSADCNQDGTLDASDLKCVTDIEQRDKVLEALNILPGDLNADGVVSFADFLVLSTNFGTNLTSYCDGNIDLQDGVNFADFLILSSNFGKQVQASDAVMSSWEA